MPSSLLEYLLGRKWFEYNDMLTIQAKSAKGLEKSESFQLIGM